MSNSRLEKFIYAICGMDIDDLPTPLSRIETLWNCLITGETPDFEPLSRNEKYLMSMLNGDVDGLPEPTSRSEKLLYKIATGETDLSDVPGYLSRYEELLKQLLESGGIGGTDFEYVLYTLNQPLSTLYTTAEGPVKSTILSGKTLVNYFPEYTKTIAIGTGNWRVIFNGKINIPLTPNTSYLFINNSNVGKKIHVSVIGETTAEKNVIANLTTNIAKFTTPDTTDNFSRMNVYLMEDNTSELTYDSFMVIPYQDGMENWDIPYFEGMQSVKMPVLTTCGKNIFSPKKMTINDGALYGYYKYRDDESVRCTLSISDKDTSVDISGIYFGTSKLGKNADGGVVWLIANGSVAYPESLSIVTNYNFISIYPNNTETLNKLTERFNIQLERSEVKTTHEPFKTNILTTTSKNLFDMNRPYDVITDSQATVTQSLDQITVSSAESGIYVNANFILDKDFFAGKTVTGSCLYESDEKDIGTVQITYQDGDGEYHYQWIRTPTTFTFPNSFIGDVMLSVSANNTGTPQSNTVTVKNIQLELGSTATPYEPYSEVVLRGIGDVKDTLDGNTGELTQRIGEVVLDGSVTPSSINTSKNNTIEVNFGRQTDMKIASRLMCDKLPNAEPYNTDIEGICCHVLNGNFHFNILKSKIENHTKQGVVDYLSQNPITVQYELEEPIVKTVGLSITDQDGQPTKLSTFNDITHVSIEAEDLLPTVDLEVPTKIEETLSTLPTLMNDISETQQLLNESIDNQAENIKEVSAAMTEIHNHIL